MQPIRALSRIYLIEDDIDDCEIFIQAVGEVSSSIHVSCSNDCINVMNKIEEFNPELIFIDLHLPKKPGLECIKEIAETAALKHVPIILFTSWNNPADINLAISLGAKLYFQKPANYTDLVKHVREVLN